MGTQTNNTFLSLMINNGQMRIESIKNFPALDPNPVRETLSNMMYKTGWNLLCITDNNVKFTFLSFPNFANSAQSEMTSSLNYFTYFSLWGIFGASASNEATIISNTLNGIINKIYIKPYLMTESQIISTFISPITTSAVVCDYFTSMFSDLGSTNL